MEALERLPPVRNLASSGAAELLSHQLRWNGNL